MEMVKLIDVCRAFPGTIIVHLIVHSNDMESKERKGSNEVRDILQGCWNAYHNYDVVVIKPIDRYSVEIQVVRE